MPGMNYNLLHDTTNYQKDFNHNLFPDHLLSSDRYSIKEKIVLLKTKVVNISNDISKYLVFILMV